MQKTKKKRASKKPKRLTISLSARDFEKLTRYAKTTGASRPLAAKRLLRQQLAAMTFEKKEVQPKNQLCLFDSVQMNIFDV